jgi:probable rRNA maturation factor
MIHIQVETAYWSLVKTPDLRKAARQTCSLLGLPENTEFTIVITGDEQVHALNLEFRRVDDTTDVLAFPSSEMDPDTGKGYLGDIIISQPRASQQAASAGHSSMDELCLLVIHGILHLAGYDHADENGKNDMFTLQREALRNLNIAIKGISA